MLYRCTPIPRLLRLLLSGCLLVCAPAAWAQARPGWTQSDNEEQTSKKSRTQALLPSENTQAVGLVGGQVSATLVAYKAQSGSKASPKAQGFIEFSSNVLVNAFSRKACHSSSCVMEVRFDGQPVQRFSLFEAAPDVYLRRVLVYDGAFFAKAFKSRSISIRLKFADSVEGVFNFRNPVDFAWTD